MALTRIAEVIAEIEGDDNNNWMVVTEELITDNGKTPTLKNLFVDQEFNLNFIDTYRQLIQASIARIADLRAGKGFCVFSSRASLIAKEEGQIKRYEQRITEYQQALKSTDLEVVARLELMLKLARKDLAQLSNLYAGTSDAVAQSALDVQMDPIYRKIKNIGLVLSETQLRLPQVAAPGPVAAGAAAPVAPAAPAAADDDGAGVRFGA